MITAILAVGLALAVIAALTAWVYVRAVPIIPSGQEMSDDEVLKILSARDTEVARRGGL